MNRTIGFITLILFVLTVKGQDEKKGLEKVLGDKTLPSITLADVNGKQVDVSGYGKSGKITILSFWATWCIPCKKELTNMADLYDDWKKKYNLQRVR